MSISTRPLSFIPLPYAMLDLIEDYAEVEIFHRLKLEFESRKDRIFTTDAFLDHIQWYISLQDLEVFLSPERFKILEKTSLLIQETQRLFSISIQFPNPIPETLSWITEHRRTLAEVTYALKHPKEAALETIDFINLCHQRHIHAVKTIVTNVKNWNELCKLEKTLKNTQEFHQVLKTILNLVDLTKVIRREKNEEKFCLKIRELIANNPDYLILIPSTLMAWKIEEKPLKKILCLIIKDIEASKEIKTQILIDLLSNEKLKFSTLIDISQYLEMDLDLLTKMFCLNIKYKNELLIDYLTRCCIIKYANSEGERSKILRRELAYLVTREPSPVDISSHLLVAVSSEKWEEILNIIYSNGFIITVENLICAFISLSAKCIIGSNSVSINFLKLLILLLKRGIKVSKNESMKLHLLLQPAAAPLSSKYRLVQRIRESKMMLKIKRRNDFFDVQRDPFIQELIKELFGLISLAKG